MEEEKQNNKDDEKMAEIKKQLAAFKKEVIRETALIAEIQRAEQKKRESAILSFSVLYKEQLGKFAKLIAVAEEVAKATETYVWSDVIPSGPRANGNFWMGDIRHCLDTIKTAVAGAKESQAYLEGLSLDSGTKLKEISDRFDQEQKLLNSAVENCEEINQDLYAARMGVIAFFKAWLEEFNNM